MDAYSNEHLSPRLDLTPLLDVVFLLLTFFIYAVAVMVRLDGLPVSLSGVGGGEGLRATPAHTLVLEADGALTYNAAPVSDLEGGTALPAVLERVRRAQADGEPGEQVLYLALEASEPTGPDRGPAVWSLLQSIQLAGVRELVVVGQPR